MGFQYSSRGESGHHLAQRLATGSLSYDAATAYIQASGGVFPPASAEDAEADPTIDEPPLLVFRGFLWGLLLRSCLMLRIARSLQGNCQQLQVVRLAKLIVSDEENLSKWED